MRLRSEWLPAPANRGRTESVYDLVLEEVDELVKAIFGVSNLNPDFFSSGLNPRALAILSEANPHAIFSAYPSLDVKVLPAQGFALGLLVNG